MIKQRFNIAHYWEVIVYYEMNYDFFSNAAMELDKAGASEFTIQEMYDKLISGEAKAATFNNTRKHISIVIINIHESKVDLLNSIIHEAEHVKQAMLNAYMVEDSGEPPAYTIGYLVSQMYKVFKHLIQDCDCT